MRFGARGAGARAALAVRGGFDVPASYGSRATSLVSHMGPFGGRALRVGDVLPVGTAPARHIVARAAAGMALPEGGARLRVLEGPHAAMFERTALESLYAERFIVTPQSNRMGYRLEGPGCITPGRRTSCRTPRPIGSLQVPASGQPILLMADRQTTGGYPKIATVISADMPLAGQLAPGDWIEFVAVQPRRSAGGVEARRSAALTGAGMPVTLSIAPSPTIRRRARAPRRAAGAADDLQGRRPGRLAD